MYRRRDLIAGGAFALVGLPFIDSLGGAQGAQPGIPPGGIPSIIEEGVVQFEYPDGTVIRIYDDRIEVTPPGKTKPEIRPYARIDIQAATVPALPRDTTLAAWLETLADNLRETIRYVVRNRGASNRHYDEMENDLSLTVYQKIVLRYKYVNRLMGLG
jgi:hypothetical protein